MVCRETAVVSGLAFLPALFRFPRPLATAKPRVPDGTAVTPGAVLADIEGPAVSVLAAERVALNLVQRLSGVATSTRRYVDALAGTGAVVLDTRKTTPGLRIFERYAVRCGGGQNHRFGLEHAFLVKDNHADGGGGVLEATRRVAVYRTAHPSLKDRLLEAEARDLDEVAQALSAGAERILLDNMNKGLTRRAVDVVRRYSKDTGRPVAIEASGGMTPRRARAAALSGVDFVSVGALTHSARAIDIALDVEVVNQRAGRS